MSLRLTSLGLLGMTLALSLGASAQKSSTLGQAIVSFCEQHKGEEVGNGECATLASQALHAAGAHGRYKDSPEKGDYVWGELAAYVQSESGGPKIKSGSLSDLRPGDLIQFRDAKFVHHSGRRWSSMSAGHHTAVVLSSQGETVKILQQNFGGKKVVGEATLNLNDLKEGWLRFYHPQPREN